MPLNTGFRFPKNTRVSETSFCAVILWYCWWKKSCITWHVRNHVKYGIYFPYQMVSRIFEPSRVWRDSTKIPKKVLPCLLPTGWLMPFAKCPTAKVIRWHSAGDFFGSPEGWDGLGGWRWRFSRRCKWVLRTTVWWFRNPKANHRLDGAKTLETNGINYQPQLVFSPDFSHQQHVSPFKDHL